MVIHGLVGTFIIFYKRVNLMGSFKKRNNLLLILKFLEVLNKVLHNFGKVILTS